MNDEISELRELISKRIEVLEKELDLLHQVLLQMDEIERKLQEKPQ